MGGAAVNSGLCGDCWGGDTGNAENYKDTDNDGICNSGAANGDVDNCPDTSNPDQLDTDGDATGNACDSSPYGGVNLTFGEVGQMSTTIFI